ncbi:MAG: hypothetical protein GY820_22180 [Gammaproteobacteria bacterium]|nr:hypothetical protein [Gammaproteobacteria bacterium]
MTKNFKFGRGKGYGNFDEMMQIRPARRTTQIEQLTNSIGAVMAEINLTPFTGAVVTSGGVPV